MYNILFLVYNNKTKSTFKNVILNFSLKLLSCLLKIVILKGVWTTSEIQCPTVDIKDRGKSNVLISVTS